MLQYLTILSFLIIVAGGDDWKFETRHKYLTHSEWHTDGKVVYIGLLKLGYQTSILEKKYSIGIKSKVPYSYLLTEMSTSYQYSTVLRRVEYSKYCLYGRVFTLFYSTVQL